MLKFVESFKKSSANSLGAQSVQKDVKKKSTQLNTVNRNEIEKNASNRKKLNKSRKRIRLLVLSIFLVLVALGVLVALILCIVNFNGNLDSKNINSNNSKLKPNELFKCDQLSNCEKDFISILIDKQCFCLSIKKSSYQQGILLCHKMRSNVFKCECRMGYRWSTSDHMCVDVDECQLGNFCSDDMSNGCINKIGSYECGCKSGFRWSTMFHTCVDINECLTRKSELCQVKNSECVNTLGGYKCVCKAGYSMMSNGSYFECEDYNECNGNKNVCTSSTCHNLPGSYECCSVFEEEYQCMNCGYPYYKPLLNVTSRRSMPRIIGGIESNPHSWPWIVSIGINYRYNLIDVKNNTISVKWMNISHICGGTLISKYTVLTAAHCVYNLEARINNSKFKSAYLKEEYLTELAKIITVYAGIHDQNLDKKNGNFSFQVRKIHIHNNFDNKMLLNDIALLILDKSVGKSNRVNWACLSNVVNFRYPPVNTTIYAAGFGSTNQNNLLISNFLRQVDLKLLKFSDCGIVTQSMISNPNSQFCAGYLNGLKDTCTGDSGSPILYKYKSRWFVIGIVSFGLGCAQISKPGINTNVSFYLNWINQRIKI